MTWNEEMEKRDLPRLMTFEDGSTVQNDRDWELRRNEIREILCRNFGGYSPNFSVKVSEKERIVEENALGGKAVGEKIILTIRSPFEIFAFPAELLIPKTTSQDQSKPWPVFVYLGFTNTPADGPAEEIIDNGFALMHICYQVLAPDQNDNFANGLGNFCSRNPFDSWGKLGMWAFGASACLDYLMTRPEVDPKRIAVMGLSRLGKASLWCGALDERFSLVVSIDSGAGGAAVFRGKKGEHVADLSRKETVHWFCGNFSSFAGRETEMPFDQHFLLAMAAPRHLYVASASLDDWSDPESELLGVMAASPAFEICNVPGLIIPDSLKNASLKNFIESHVVLHEGNIGYHVRCGTHYLGREDWQHVMEYRRMHQV